MRTLESGVKNAKNAVHYVFGRGSILELEPLLLDLREDESSYAIYLIDSYFEKNPGPLKDISKSDIDFVIYVDTKHEPKTDDINLLLSKLQKTGKDSPFAIIGIGGGSAVDLAKGFPLLTTKRMFWKGIVEELLFFIRGEVTRCMIQVTIIRYPSTWIVCFV